MASLPSTGNEPHQQSLGAVAAAVIFALTIGQLAVATWVPGLPQFEGKAFGARLVAYPVLMAAVPVGWFLKQRRGRHGLTAAAAPWTAFALIMAPFLIDVTGNTANLYDTVDRWDDVNHFVNWWLLCWGLGQLTARADVRRGGCSSSRSPGSERCWRSGGSWASGTPSSVTALSWTPPTRTRFGDEALGTLGGLVAALLVRWRQGRDTARDVIS
ncbi:MAG: hypothetical protein ACR2LE_06530 [Nocardioidaceae bacterium]